MSVLSNLYAGFYEGRLTLNGILVHKAIDADAPLNIHIITRPHDITGY
jgi:hypothetical protein